MVEMVTMGMTIGKVQSHAIDHDALHGPRLGGGRGGGHKFKFSHDVINGQQLFVDAASKAQAYCYVIFGSSFCTRFGWCESSRHNQKAAEIFGLCSALRLAVHTGWKRLFLFGDNEASINRGLGIRAYVGLEVPQRLLKTKIVHKLWAHKGIQIWVSFITRMQLQLLKAAKHGKQQSQGGDLQMIVKV